MTAQAQEPGSQLQILRALQGEYGDALFADFTVLLVQHLLPDSEPLIDAFLYSCLRKNLFVVGIPYSSKRDILVRIAQKLDRNAICVPSVYPFYERQWCDTKVREVFDAAISNCGVGQKLLIVEDGPYALPYLMRNRPNAAQYCVGVVQQTTRGLTAYSQLGSELRGIIDFCKNNATH